MVTEEYNINQIIKKIEVLTNNKETDKALDLCNYAIRDYPKSEDLYFKRAYLFINKEMYDEATNDMDMLLTLTHDDSPLEKRLQPLFTKARWAITFQRDYDKAITMLTIIIDEKCQYFLSSSFLLRAWAYLQMGETVKALDDCTKVPSDAMLYLGREIKLISTSKIKK